MHQTVKQHKFLLFASLLVYALVAGSAFLFTSYASQDIPPFTLCSLRLLVGCVGLTVLSIGTQGKTFFKFICNKRVLLVGIILGVFNNFLPYSLYPYAFYLGVDVGISSIFSGTTPLFALLFAACFLQNGTTVLKQPLTILGMGLGVLGIFVVSVGDISDPEFSFEIIIGYMMLLCYAASKGFASVYANLNIMTYSILGIATIQTFSGFCLAFLCSITIDFWFPPSGYAPHYQFFATTSWKTWGGVLYLGLGPSLLCYVLQFHLVKEVGSVKQVTVDFLTPIVGMIEGALFAGDWSGESPFFIASEIIGSFILASGVFLVHAEKKKISTQPEERRKLTEHAAETIIN